MRDDTCCDRFKELLPDYLDDALAPDRRADVRRHLDRCAACRGSLEALGRLERELARLPSLTLEGAAVAAAVTGRLGLRRRSRAIILLRLVPLDRLALPLGIAAMLLATYRFVGGMLEGMIRGMTGWLTHLANAVGGLQTGGPLMIDPLVFYAITGLLLIAFGAAALTALHIVRR